MDDECSPLPALADLILEQAAEAVIYSNAQGIIERWNGAASSMFGFTADQALGQSLDLVIPERLRAAHWRGFDAAMKSGATRLHGRPTLTSAMHQSGRKIYVEMSFALVKDMNGTAVGSVAIARDVTERIERERQAATDK